jgi:hypothetical protein
MTMPDDRKCRICGCTEVTPCVDDVGNTCAWVDHDLCSACLVKAAFGDAVPPELLACSAGMGDALSEYEERTGEQLDDGMVQFALFFYTRGFQRALEYFDDAERTLDQPLAVPEKPGLILPGDFQQ